LDKIPKETPRAITHLISNIPNSKAVTYSTSGSNEVAAAIGVPTIMMAQAIPGNKKLIIAHSSEIYTPNKKFINAVNTTIMTDHNE